MTKRLAGVITAVILCVPLACTPSQAWSRSPQQPLTPAGAFRPASIGEAPVPGGGSGTIGMLPRVLVGNAPQDSVFDPVTHTVYVANQGDNTMSVVNARTC